MVAKLESFSPKVQLLNTHNTQMLCFSLTRIGFRYLFNTVAAEAASSHY
jgi:Acyl transferase domain